MRSSCNESEQVTARPQLVPPVVTEPGRGSFPGGHRELAAAAGPVVPRPSAAHLQALPRRWMALDASALRLVRACLAMGIPQRGEL